MKPSAAEIEAFITRAFAPSDGEPALRIEYVDEEKARLRMVIRSDHLRPGATVAGPVQMALVDTAAWTLILHNKGFAFAPSVTSNLNMNFLRRPEPKDLLAEAHLLKLGKRLSVAEVKLFSEGNAAPVAHATVTYAVVEKKKL